MPIYSPISEGESHMPSAAVYNDYSQEALDSQYNILGLIPEAQEVFSRYRSNSQALRNRCGALAYLNLAYGDDELQALDYFRADVEGRPLVIFIHGGYWRSQDKSWFSYVAEPFLQQGLNVAVVNYRLAPAARLDAIVEDVRLAILWLYRNAADLGFDADRIHVCGSSAGGHLTVEMLATDWVSRDAPVDLVKSGCALSGIFDLEPIRLCFLNKVIDLDITEARRNSPLYHLPQNLAPLILAVGGIESAEFQRQQNRFAAACRSSRQPVLVVSQEGGNHFDMVDRLADRRSEIFSAFLLQING
jgi:arylformamidase